VADHKDQMNDSADVPPSEPAAPGLLAVPAAAAQCPVVGIGSSAGGLEALAEFFGHMPPDSGLAFVVVTHQQQDHSSFLAELLGKRTVMPVHQVTTAIVIEPNHVYVSAPGTNLALLRGVLQPMEMDQHAGLHLPIDFFFRSLAEDQQDRAICLILSGAGSDGTVGLQAIKGAGGMALVQKETTAKFDGMPRSAIATGLVDYVLPVEHMPPLLVAFARSPYLRLETAPPVPTGLAADLLRQIVVLLRSRTKHDFSAYKPTTLRRRIERRMLINQIQTAEQYVRFLGDTPHELDLLFQELLIGVTSFFRDPEVFTLLAATVFPDLLASGPEQPTLRVWIPGCSTGEEAYSVAIVLQECLERRLRPCQVQIFATDVNRQAIEKARTGRYPEGIAADVSPERLDRYFTREEGEYRIRKEIREMMVFAPHNILADPPFTKLDLLSCRNLLIYLEADAQRRLVPMFHYALNPSGLLLLGSAETIGEFTDLFTPLDRKWKLFRRSESTAVPAPVREFPMTARLAGSPATTAAGGSTKAGVNLTEAVEKFLVQRLVPPSVLVTDKGDLVYIHGRPGLLLQAAPGPARLNLFDMAGEGLRLPLIAAIRQAVAHNTTVLQKGVEVKTNGDFSTVDVMVEKITDPESLRGLLLVTFQSVTELPAPRAKSRRGQAKAPPRRWIEELEHENQALRDSLQRTVEEAESASEELTATNEELQSTNEELQSANEELETTREELQSLNEELQTTNSELQGKIDVLAHANDDLTNLLYSAEIAALFLDNQLRIKRFTPQAQRVIHLIPSDVGRPVGDLVSYLEYDRLQADADEVLRTLAFKEGEVSTPDGVWYVMRMRPYRTSENVIDGVVMTFTDISAQKQAEQQRTDARIYAETVMETVPDPVLVLDTELRVISANRAFSRTFHLTAQEVSGQHVYELGSGQWNIAQLRALLEDLVLTRSSVEDVTVEHQFALVGRKILRVNARRVERATGLPSLIIVVMTDMTERARTA
jgi:two-component system, chemotaxis family, CheB/CheR fusion protein